MTFESIGGVKARSVGEFQTDMIDSEKKFSEITVQPMPNSQQKGSAEESETKEGQATEKQIRDAVSQANQKIKHNEGTKLEFSYHEKTKRVSIQVIDKDTKELIREIPPEKSLDMLQKMWELAGILVDERR